MPPIFNLFFHFITHCVSLEKEMERKLEHFLIIHKTYTALGFYPTLNVFALGRPYAEQSLFFLALELLKLVGLQASEAGFSIKW